MTKLSPSITTVRILKKVILCGALFLTTSSMAMAQALVPNIQVLPGTNVEVGEEVYLSGSGSTYDGNQTLLRKARYEWDFGDGYYLRYDPSVKTITRQGLCATHYYMTPGDFAVVLKVSLFPGWNEDGTPAGIISKSSNNFTIASGPMTFNVEPGLKYVSGMNGQIRHYENDKIIAYMSATLTSYNSQTGELIVNVYETHGFRGLTYSSWVTNFEVLPIEIQTTTTVMHVTGESPMTGFEIQRAPFQNRLAQYLFVQIPTDYRGNDTILKVTLEGAKGGKSTLLSKNNLTSEERVLLDHKPLAQDDYVLIAELLNSSGQRIPGGLWRDKFSKPYAGIPKVGIDENNSFRVNGELFFPVGSYMLDLSRFQTYKTQASLNMFHTLGYAIEQNPTTLTTYLSAAETSALKVIGPGRGDYEALFRSARWKWNHNPERMAEYVQTGKDSPAMLAWTWQDEPNLGGRTIMIYPQTLAAWAYNTHRADSQHPVFNGYYGSDWSKYYGTGLRDFDYLNSAQFFGGKKWVQEAFGFDIYPIQLRLHPALNFTDMGPHAAYLDAMDRMRANNKDLVPLLPALNPGQRTTDQADPGQIPTADQVYLQAWMNVIHGARGIIWFPYFIPSTIQWGAMKKFADQMSTLAPAVLQPEPSRTVTDDADVPLKRVDTMIREYGGNIYLFAARVTEPAPMEGAKYLGVEPESITVNYTVSGLAGNLVAEVVDEGRQVSLTDGKFADTYARNAVHIYKIPLGANPVGVSSPVGLRIVK